MNFNRMAEFHCLASKDFRYIYEHPSSREGGYLWPFFTTDVGQNLALQHFTKVGNLFLPLVGKKVSHFQIFKFQNKKTIQGIVSKQFCE